MSKKTQECAVYVSSVDHFSDIWPQFFHCFYKQWPEPLYDVHLIANYRSFGDPRVKNIQLGEDQHWGSNMLRVLDQCDCEYILYMQDDYLMRQPVSNAFIQSAVAFLRDREAHYLNLQYPENETMPIEGSSFDGVNPKEHWLLGLQAALWRVQTLKDVVQAGWTPWDAESELNRFAKAQNAEGFYTLNQAQAHEFDYIQAVKGGFWLKEALDYCRIHDVPVNLSRRPCPPWGETFLKQNYRSLLKRKMRLQRSLEATFAKRKKVLPL